MNKFLEYLKDEGYIPYEDLENIPGSGWVSHKNCPKTSTMHPHHDRVLDEEIMPGIVVAMCWGCGGKMVDPDAMDRIRAQGKPVETPGVSCWWICQL